MKPVRAPLLAQLVIVSNRVAIPEKNAKARAGGLEVAVKAALKHKSGIWFGWSGKVAARTKIATHRVMHDGITYITLDLSKEDHHEYYNGFTNRTDHGSLRSCLSFHGGERSRRRPSARGIVRL